MFGVSQCTGRLSADARLTTQAQRLSLTWRNVKRKDTKMQEAPNISPISDRVDRRTDKEASMLENRKGKESCVAKQLSCVTL